MAIQALDERHKTLAEELLKGTPRAKIAEKVGVHRATLYEWMKDPLWQQYFEKLAQDMDEARGMRLLVTVMKMAEVTEAYLDFLLGEISTQDRDRIAQLPGLDTISTALKRLVEVERIDSGQPTKIARSDQGKETTVPPAAEKRGREVKSMLSRVLARGEETQH